MTTDSDTAHTPTGAGRLASPRLILCAVDDALADAWETVAAQSRQSVSVHHGSILDTGADAVVSPANSHGYMRGGIDAVYARTFDGIEQRVRNAILTLHGGELPVGQVVAVPTETTAPSWLITAPTMRRPGEALAADTVHPYLAARAVFEFWCENGSELGIASIAMPGLGTGVGQVEPQVCARQVAAAWDEVFGVRIPPAR